MKKPKGFGDLPKLVIKPYEDADRTALMVHDLETSIDGVDIKGLHSLTLELKANDVNMVTLEIIPGEIDVDVTALQEIQAIVEKRAELKGEVIDVTRTQDRVDGYRRLKGREGGEVLVPAEQGV